MQVIMVDSEKLSPNQVSPRVITESFLERHSPKRKLSKDDSSGQIKLVKVGEPDNESDSKTYKSHARSRS